MGTRSGVGKVAFGRSCVVGDDDDEYDAAGRGLIRRRTKRYIPVDVFVQSCAFWTTVRLFDCCFVHIYHGCVWGVKDEVLMIWEKKKRKNGVLSIADSVEMVDMACTAFL